MQARNMGPRILRPSFEIQSILQSNFREPPLREHTLAPKLCLFSRRFQHIVVVIMTVMLPREYNNS